MMLYHNGVLFVHIPKTAGTSITNHIIGNAGARPIPKELYKHATLDDIRENPAYGIDPGRVGKIITMLRNPYDWVVSFYYFQRRIYEGNLYGEAETPRIKAAGNMTFVEHLRWVVEERREAPAARPSYSFKDYITLNGELPEALEDFFFEDVPSCLCQIAGLFGVDNYDFPHAVKTPHPPWQELHTAESEALVYELCGWAFDNAYYERVPA